jgi:solute carrier family 35 protein F5
MSTVEDHEQRGLVTPSYAPTTPPDLLRARADDRRNQRIGAMLVIFVALLYVGSGVAIQLLFEQMDFEKPFFFSYVSVALCSVHLLQYIYLRGRRSWLRGKDYRQLDELEQTQVSIINEPWLLVRPALLLSPAYFCLNYTYFLSLDLTSVSETMILSASTGIWTLLFSRILLKERVTHMKLATVAVSILGMCLVTYSSRGHKRAAAGADEAGAAGAAGAAAPGEAAAAAAESVDEAGAGDLLALMSAAASGIYVVLLRACVPDEDSVHMPSLFGMIGLVSAVCFAPLFPLFHYSGVEEFELPPTRQALCAVVLNAILSTVLPDMLLAQAVVMTSPLLATLGLSTMIPLSVVADYARGLANLTPRFFVGTLCVFVGFQLENWAEMHAEAAKAVSQ